MNLEVHSLSLPFKRSFDHASASRSQTSGVVVIVSDDDRICGYGEAAPRSYVTGESEAGVKEVILKLASEASTIIEFQQLNLLKENHHDLIKESPSAWCALEMAFLDYFGRKNKLPIETLLEAPLLPAEVQYSAVLGIQEIPAFKKSVAQYAALQISDVKLKITGDSKQDGERLQILKEEFGSALRLRLDGNNVFSSATEVMRYLASLPFTPWGLEEPLPVNKFSELNELSTNGEMKIILDESCTLDSIVAMLRLNPEGIIPNLRVSKLAGIINTRSLAAACIQNGNKIIFGCHVGETSLLTRAALAASSGFESSIVAREGAFGTYLLERDITQAPIMFSHHGRLDTAALRNLAGLGVEVTAV